jgi:hypothetical protein
LLCRRTLAFIMANVMDALSAKYGLFSFESVGLVIGVSVSLAYFINSLSFFFF